MVEGADLKPKPFDSQTNWLRWNVTSQSDTSSGQWLSTAVVPNRGAAAP